MTGKALAILAFVVLIGAAIATYFIAGWPTALEDEEAARAVVEEFGRKMQHVNVLEDKTMAADAVGREYGPLVTSALLAQWQNDPTQAPGRLTSSPWPERIDIKSAERESRSRYVFEGDIVEVSQEGGGIREQATEAVRRPVVIAVEEEAGTWRIQEFVLGAYPGEAKWISSEPSEQGLIFLYPERIPTSFISASEWPPMVERIVRSNTCVESAPVEGEAGATTKKRMVGEREYCVTLKTEGAVGSLFETYEYTFELGGVTYRVAFTLRKPQCANYDEPQKSACLAEQTSFDIDGVVDRIAQSIQIVPQK